MSAIFTRIKRLAVSLSTGKVEEAAHTRSFVRNPL
jgi:hypothetical protein